MANPEWTEPTDFGPDADDLALAIRSLYEEASNNLCSCGSDPEGHCSYCGAWAAADRECTKLIREALSQ